MTSTSAEAFLAFDWGKSDAWQTYFQNLYPTPPASKVPKWKRKWYKQNVDTSFDADSNLGDPITSSTASKNDTTTSSSSSSSSTGRTTTTTTTTNSTSSSIKMSSTQMASIFVVAVGMVASVVYILPFGSAKAYNLAVSCYMVGFLCDIFARRGYPQFNAEYLQLVFLNDRAQTLLLVIVAYQLRSWLALISPFTTGLLLLSECFEGLKSRIPKSIAAHPMLNKGANILESKRYDVMQHRASTEVILGLSCIAMTFMRRVSLMTTVFYWSALRIKYTVNSFTQMAFAKLDEKITSVLTLPFVPALIFTLYTKVRAYLKGMVAQER